MAQVKAYLFWIICGVILIAEIIVIATVHPTAPGYERYKDRAVVLAKQNADKQYNELKNDLLPKAQKVNAVDGPLRPARPISPENLAEVDEFLETHLIHGSWADDFQQVVDAYSQQLLRIKEDLLQRSALLDEPIESSDNSSLWYEEYRARTADMLQQLVAEGIITSDSPIERNDMETDTSLRARFGLYTKSSEFPEPDEHPELTERFRILESLARALVGVKVPVPANPMMTPMAEQELITLPTEDLHGVVVENVSWDRRVPEASYPEMSFITFEVDLRGSAAALLAAGSAIDNISELPFTRMATEWERADVRQNMRGEAFEPMQQTVRIAVIDFRQIDIPADLVAQEGTP